MTGEVYLCLCLHLIDLFSQDIPLAKRLDFTADPNADILLKKFRLLNQFQLDIPTCWVRFSEQLQQQVVESTCELLKHRDQEQLCAMECLAAVDSNALWFKKWMISFQGRSTSVEAIEKGGLTKQLVYTFLKFYSKLRESGDEDTRPLVEVGDKVLDFDDLEYLGFLHSMVMLTKLCQYSGGRSLFPITIEANLKNDCEIYEMLKNDKILSHIGDQGINQL
jgi:hypothetical protein